MSARAEPRRAPASARPTYRPRPAPRAGGPRSTRIRWDKAGRVALVLVLFLILAGYVKPMIGFLGAWRQSGAEQQALADLKSERDVLEARAMELRQPDADERHARELGMVLSGEQAYVVDHERSDRD